MVIAMSILIAVVVTVLRFQVEGMVRRRLESDQGAFARGALDFTAVAETSS